MSLKTYLSKERGRASRLSEYLKVSPVTVHYWAVKKKRVPSDHCPSIERFTNREVRCEDMRPDVDWGYLRGTLPLARAEEREAA